MTKKQKKKELKLLLKLLAFYSKNKLKNEASIVYEELLYKYEKITFDLE